MLSCHQLANKSIFWNAYFLFLDNKLSLESTLHFGITLVRLDAILLFKDASKQWGRFGSINLECFHVMFCDFWWSSQSHTPSKWE